MDSSRRLASLRLVCFLFSFRGEFLCHGFLEFLIVHSVTFDGVHENVVAACGASLIRRIRKADFQKQLAQFGFVPGAYLLGQEFLCGRGVFLRLNLVPLRQSRNLAVGKVANQVVCEASKSAFFNGADTRCRIVAKTRWRVVMASGGLA
jgi:hypothetical protein